MWQQHKALLAIGEYKIHPSQEINKNPDYKYKQEMMKYSLTLPSSVILPNFFNCLIKGSI